MHLWLPLLIALAAVPVSSSAGLVTVEFEGVITEIRDGFDLLPDVPVGAVFAGKYVYDDSVKPISCGGGLTGLSSGPITVDECATYVSRGNPAPGIALDVGGASFTFSNAISPTVPLAISIGARGSDWYSARWLRDILPHGRRQDWVEIEVRGPTGSLFDSTQLTVPDIGGADSATLTFLAQHEGVPVSELSEERRRLRDLLFCRDSAGGCGDPQDDLAFRISTIVGDLTRLRVVPEPHAADLLLPFGLLLTSLRRHRQRL